MARTQPPLLGLLVGAAAVFAYSAAIHLCLVWQWPQMRLVLAAAPLVLMLLTACSRVLRPGLGLALLGALAGFLYWQREALWQAQDLVVLLQYLSTYGALGWLFASSLRAGAEPLCTRLARRARGDNMPPAVLHYTRRLTACWAIYFVASLALSLLLYGLASRELWSFFDNVLSPLLLLALFALEYALRRRLLPSVAHASWRENLALMRLRDEVQERP